MNTSFNTQYLASAIQQSYSTLHHI